MGLLKKSKEPTVTKPEVQAAKEQKSVNVQCFVARDRSGGLVGIYTQKPTEIVVKDSKIADSQSYFRAPAGCLLHTLPSATFQQLFKLEIGLGECYAADLNLSLKV